MHIIECLWMYSCSFKRKWFYGCKFWLTTELQKRIQIPSIKCPSWTDSCLIWQPHLSLLPTNSCVLGILKTPDSSCFHSCYFLCLNTFPSLTLWNTYSYFKSKIKHHFLIMHFPTFSSPSDSRKHPGMVCYIWHCLGVIWVHVCLSHFVGKALDFLHNPRM